MAYQTAPDASFVIHAGDLINSAHSDYEWAQWYKAGGFIHSQWTAIPVVGNHEFRSLINGDERKLSIQWKPQFTLPVEKELDNKLHETVYTVDYQNIRIIVLNSNGMFEKQTKYIEQQLKTSPAKWNIVTCHHSVFSPAVGRDFKYARKKWKPLFDQYNVDLVLNGHDHTYARGHVPKISTTNETENIGTIYVTSVSGPKQYDLDKKQIETYSKEGYQLDKSAEQTQFFQVITVDKNKLTYVAYTALGKEYDRAVIKKDFDTGIKSFSD
jgi:predicted phosphodiesterase